MIRVLFVAHRLPQARLVEGCNIDRTASIPYHSVMSYRVTLWVGPHSATCRSVAGDKHSGRRGDPKSYHACKASKMPTMNRRSFFAALAGIIAGRPKHREDRPVRKESRAQPEQLEWQAYIDRHIIRWPGGHLTIREFDDWAHLVEKQGCLLPCNWFITMEKARTINDQLVSGKIDRWAV